MDLATVPIIDSDTHLSEPPDLWTSRMSAAKWGDRIPHLVFDERMGEERWVIGDTKLTGVANWATAGWGEFPPSHPKTIEEADPGAFEPGPRVERMDAQGIAAEVIYPNILGFSTHALLALKDPALMLEIVQAYNDYLTDFASYAPERFIILTNLPFWDVQASVDEIERCHDLGHRGILFGSKPHKVNMPRLADDHWSPIFGACQDRQLSVNFHVGFQAMDQDDMRAMIGVKAARSEYARLSSLAMLGLAEGLGDILLSGVCHKFPAVNFVSVESGFGWLPFFVESLDWQWINSGAATAYPERDMPSEYFRRQVYGSFWFEHETVERMIDLYADNVMFESDYPHPTSLSPGPATSALSPRDTVMRTLKNVDDEVCRKVLYGNAARLYHVPEAQLRAFSS